MGFIPTRRDDIISIIYVLVFLINGIPVSDEIN